MSWQAASFALAALAAAAGLGWYERSRPESRVVAMVATLAALAVAGRVAFAVLPNVKPTTDIVLFAGYALGGAAGFAVGAVTAVASNVFLGQGPWTPWQMGAWGVVGIGGALLARLARGREPGRLWLAAACGVAGMAFGAIMDVYQWSFTAGHDAESYLAVSATSLPYNLAHAIGNVVFALLIGPAFVRALRRFRARFDVNWPAPAPAVGLVAVALLVGVAVQPSVSAAFPAAAAPAALKAERYLRAAQNADGGFGPAPGQSSSALHTGWSALGLAAAGRNPRDQDRRAKSSVDYIRAHIGQIDDIGDIERTLLVLRAAGLPPRIGGRDLLAQLLKRRRANGSIGGTVDHTAFGIFALRASGRSTRSREVRAAARFLLSAQNEDGGYGFSKSAASDVDDTGTVLQALAASGRRGSPAVGRAVRYLRRAQRPDGGFGQMASSASNAQSTAWAVQGLIAVGRDPGGFKRGSRTPIAYLVSLQAPNGSIRYSRTSAQTPVWVTAEALTALKGKAFPLPPVPRKATASAASPTATTTTSASPTPGATKPRAARKSRRKRQRPAASPVARASDVEATPTSDLGVSTSEVETPPRPALAVRTGSGDSGSAGAALIAAAAALGALFALRRLPPFHTRIR